MNAWYDSCWNPDRDCSYNKERILYFTLSLNYELMNKIGIRSVNSRRG